MNKNFINKVFILCGAIALGGSLFLLKDNPLHAEDAEIVINDIDDVNTNNEEVLENENTRQAEDIMPLDMQTVTLTINEAQNNAIVDLIVKINGVEYPYASNDFVDNVLTVSLEDSNNQMIELLSDQYYFEPSFVMVNQGDLQGNYNIQAFAGQAPDAMEGAVIYGADGIQKDIYENDEVVTVSIATKNPLHRVFYQIENDEWKMSNDDLFEVTSRQQSEHVVSIAYYIQYYYPQEQEPSVDSFNEPSAPARLSIQFAAANTNDDNNDPEKPNDPIISDNDEESFTGEDGNTYTKEDIKLTVEEMDEDDYEKYQRVIAYFDEFKEIPAAQITYYQAALYAQGVRVQPNEMYNLLLPYPPGTSADKEFIIYQFKDGNTDGAALLNYTAGSDGLHVKVDNVSAFIIGWKDKTADNEEVKNDKNEALENQSGSDTTTGGGVNTGDSTSIMLWISLLCCSYFATMISIQRKAKNYHQ